MINTFPKGGVFLLWQQKDKSLKHLQMKKELKL